jgi:hypothetical protein
MATADPTSAFYKASIEETLTLSATTVSAQFVDVDGLTAGRWLLQVIPSADTVVVWVQLGSMAVSSGVMTVTAGAGPKKMPLSSKTIVAVEFFVSGSFNNAPPAVICVTGTAECYLTRVSV